MYYKYLSKDYVIHVRGWNDVYNNDNICRENLAVYLSISIFFCACCDDESLIQVIIVI